MSRVRVGKWGKNLAIRVPHELAQTSGLSDGEQVEIEMKDGDLLVRRPAIHARGEAQTAAKEILRESRKYTLGDVTLKELRDAGRR